MRIVRLNTRLTRPQMDFFLALPWAHVASSTGLLQIGQSLCSGRPTRCTPRAHVKQKNLSHFGQCQAEGMVG